MLRQFTTSMIIELGGRGLPGVTRPVTEWVDGAGISYGLLTLFVRHNSASLLIQENADADVRDDLDPIFARLVPQVDPLFRHRDEGVDNMPAHVRSALTNVDRAGLISTDTLIGGLHLDGEHERKRTKTIQREVQAASRARDSRARLERQRGMPPHEGRLDARSANAGAEK